MLRVSANLDPLLARPFGISSVISKRSIELYYRVAGRGTTLLTTVEPGQMLDLLGPLGNGFPVPDKTVTLFWWPGAADSLRSSISPPGTENRRASLSVPGTRSAFLLPP
jgi:hypothetical protein